MKTLLLAGLTLSLFFLSLPLQAQTPEPPPTPPPEPLMENPADAYGSDVLIRADQKLQANDKDGAMALLTDNFDRFAKLRAGVFGKMQDVFLAQDNIQEARQSYLQYAKYDQELARAGIDKVYSYYLKKKDEPAVIEWTGQLMNMPLPDDLLQLVYMWRLKAVCSAGITPEAQAMVKNSCTKFNPETCRPIFSPAIAALIEGGKYDDAGRLLNMIEKDGKSANALRSLVIAARIRIIFLQGKWKEGEALFMKKAADLSDDDLAELIAFTAAKAQKGEEFDAVDRMAMFIIKNEKENNRPRIEAATCSLNMLKMNNKAAGIPARFEQLLEMGLPPVALYSLYCDYFYIVITAEDKESAKQITAFSDKLSAKLDKPDDKKQMALFLVDGLFAAGDYAGALQALDANKQYWQGEWLDSARDKIEAHLALQKKNYREAVEGFRKYMDYIAKNRTGAFNPVSCQLYTPDMLLGLNALRIGDILRDNLNDEKGAQKAYNEAEQYFNKAAKEVKPNSKESEYIQKQMAELAARKKK